MALNTPLSLDFNHQKGYEIPTKHKEAILQLHWFGKVPVCALMVRYKLGDTTIRKILGYPAPERFRPNRKGPTFLLSNAKVDEIILHCAESWENRIMQWPKLREELGLKCSVETLERRLHARGYSSMYRMPKALLNFHTSQGTIPLGSYILDSGVVKGPLVGRSDLLSWGQICEGEGYTELSREAVLDVYPISNPSWSYDGSWRLGSNWIWLQEPVDISPWIRQKQRY